MTRQPAGRRSIEPVRDGDLLLLRPARAAEVLGVSRVTIYALLAVGKLKSLRIGRARLITVASIRALGDSGGVPDLDGATMRSAVGASGRAVVGGPRGRRTMSALDLDALATAVTTAMGCGWSIPRPDGGADIFFMFGGRQRVLTVMADGAARLVDADGAKRPDEMAHLLNWLQGKGFAVRDADAPADAPRQVNTFIRPDGPPNRPSPPPRAWRRR